MVYISFNMILQGGISNNTKYFIKINYYFGYNLTETLAIFIIKYRLQSRACLSVKWATKCCSNRSSGLNPLNQDHMTQLSLSVNKWFHIAHYFRPRHATVCSYQFYLRTPF